MTWTYPSLSSTCTRADLFFPFFGHSSSSTTSSTSAGVNTQPTKVSVTKQQYELKGAHTPVNTHTHTHTHTHTPTHTHPHTPTHTHTELGLEKNRRLCFDFDWRFFGGFCVSVCESLCVSVRAVWGSWAHARTCYSRRMHV